MKNLEPTPQEDCMISLTHPRLGACFIVVFEQFFNVFFELVAAVLRAVRPAFSPFLQWFHPNHPFSRLTLGYCSQGAVGHFVPTQLPQVDMHSRRFRPQHAAAISSSCARRIRGCAVRARRTVRLQLAGICGVIGCRRRAGNSSAYTRAHQARGG